MEFRVTRLDAKIKAVGGGMDKALHIKNGMVRLRQAVQRKHSEDRTKGGAQDRQLESYGNERRPAIQRPATDILRVGNNICPPLETKTSKSAREAAEKGNERNHVALQAHGMGETFHRKRRKRVIAVIAGGANLFHGVNQLLRSIELRDYAKDVRTMFHP